jgi:hypothetical protein
MKKVRSKGRSCLVPIFFNRVPCHKGVLGSGDIAPRILDLGTRRRRVVSFTSREEPVTHWIGGWVGHSRSGRGAERLSCSYALTEHHAMKAYWGEEV